MISLNAADVDKLLHSVLVRHVTERMLAVRYVLVRRRSQTMYALSMPCHNVEWCVLLFARKKLSSDLVDDYTYVSPTRQSIEDSRRRTLPRGLIQIEAGNRTLKVSRVCQAMRTQWTQVRQLKVGAEDFEDICEHPQLSACGLEDDVPTSAAGTVWQTDLELDAPLNDDQFTWPNHQPSCTQV